MKQLLLEKKWLVLPVILLAVFSCTQPEPTDMTREAIIPKPVSVTADGSAFELTANTVVSVQEGSDSLSNIAVFLAKHLGFATGFSLQVDTVKEEASRGIYLSLSNLPELGQEGYRLVVGKKRVILTANTPEGVFRGIQTIRQLLPAKIESDVPQEGPWIIPGGTVTDYPEYAYRGAMLDVARHFFSVEEVKHFIDLLSAYKMNVLHLHLTDDQGWRIEIKSWPELTKIGGSTEVGGESGGFYTQEQYQEIVKYAAERFITIVPEVDMPGHTNAALASYAELNCNGKATKLYTGTEVGFSTLCTDKEITYQFIDDVVREIAAITPGPYFHMGGDESHVTKKEDYIPFVERVQQIVTAHNKVAIGWDEITLAKLDGKTIAQYWSSAENAKAAAAQNIKLIMSPAKKAYLDMQYDSLSPLGLHWAGYVEVDTGYNWDPASLEEGITRENILGIEAPLWSETIKDKADIEYLTLPRLPGYAEIGWTPVTERNWDDYKQRLAEHGKRFKIQNLNFYPSKLVPWVE
ncbi:MAG: beta-N-acetylhexosaminidase [Prolixibacteraceae bacterium]